jgi:hypothetical protein
MIDIGCRVQQTTPYGPMLYKFGIYTRLPI